MCKFKNITLSDSIVNIKDLAFYNCTSLEKILLPNNLATIGEYVFSGCTNLEYNIYDNAKYLGNDENPYLILISPINNTIENCVINSNTKIIAPSSMINCESLKSIIIPSSVKKIGKYAFCYCIQLEEVYISSGVDGIEQDAFIYCENLRNIYCEDKFAPDTWEQNWDRTSYSGYYYANIVWGY